MSSYSIENPFIFIIFGASGDLAKLKIFPAIYSLMTQKRLPDDFYIIGFARTKKSRQEFQKEFEKSIRERHKNFVDEKLLKELIDKVYYFSGQYDLFVDYKKFRKFLNKLTDKKADTMTKLVYFAVPPGVFPDIIQNLGETRSSPDDDMRLILEKPFGNDETSARELFHIVCKYFNEKNIYLLDHYLGKGAVQSILNLRHANRILNLILQGNEVANIQITAFEKLGIQKRAGYFENTGTLKDMVQSHLLQVLALITMSIPITESAYSMHREKYSILSAISYHESPENIILGQYASYKKNPGVPKNSQTETFVAARLFIDREMWYQVPIYIRTGKKIHKKLSYIVIELKKYAFQEKEEPNRLIIEFQPKERIHMSLVVKTNNGTSKSINLTTADSIPCIGEECLPEHSILLLDAMHGNKMNFISFPEIIATWRITDKIHKLIKDKKINVERYEDYKGGPASQHKLTKMDGVKWYDLPVETES